MGEFVLMCNLGLELVCMYHGLVIPFTVMNFWFDTFFTGDRLLCKCMSLVTIIHSSPQVSFDHCLGSFSTYYVHGSMFFHVHATETLSKPVCYNIQYVQLIHKQNIKKGDFHKLIVIHSKMAKLKYNNLYTVPQIPHLYFSYLSYLKTSTNGVKDLSFCFYFFIFPSRQ